MFEFCTLKYFDIFDIDIFIDIFENVARHFDMSKAVVSLDIFRQRHVATTNVVNNPNNFIFLIERLKFLLFSNPIMKCDILNIFLTDCFLIDLFLSLHALFFMAPWTHSMLLLESGVNLIHKFKMPKKALNATFCDIHEVDELRKYVQDLKHAYFCSPLIVNKYQTSLL